MIPKGTIIAIGGAEDKGLGIEGRLSLDYIEDGILSHVVARAGGTKANILVITSASSIPVGVGARYLEAFDKLGCDHVQVLHVDSRDFTNSVDFVAKLDKCDAVMFSGGNQTKLTDIWRGSMALEVIRRRYFHEDFMIAGTSAGAVAMSDIMIAGGRSDHAMLKGAVKLGKGLGLLENVIFDSHFIMRGRFGRLAEAVAIHDDLLGIGLGEDTGLIIEKGNFFTTIGSGMVLFFDASELIHNTVQELSNGIPITISNLKVHVLANSDRYDLKKKRVEVLPVDAEFI